MTGKHSQEIPVDPTGWCNDKPLLVLTLGRSDATPKNRPRQRRRTGLSNRLTTHLLFGTARVARQTMPFIYRQ